MKREDFIKIIKLRSAWKIDKRKGNYTLANGEKLSKHIRTLVESQMQLDHILIASDGNLYFGLDEVVWSNETHCFNDFTIMPPFKENEICSYDEQEKRISLLIGEIVG